MKIVIPKYEPNTDITFENSEKLSDYCKRILQQIADNQFMENTKTSNPEIQTIYRQLLEAAISLECENEFNDFVKGLENQEGNDHCKFWALPKPLEHEARKDIFPINSLPDALRNYVVSVAKYSQVPYEMCVLPLLSTLATCAQGKAKVEDPQNGYTSELTLFTLTVAPSSARKSSSKEFYRITDSYQNHYNDVHKMERIHRQSEREVIQQQRKKAVQTGNTEKVKELDEELEEKPELPKMLLKMSDATPEALINAMYSHNEKMAVLDSEGGILSTISRNYSGNNTDVSFLCTAYDGDSYYSSRVSTGDKDMKRPLLTLGLLTQPKKFYDFINNEEFQEKGLINRFLFAFPEVEPGDKKWSNYRIPENEYKAFSDIANKLLSLPESQDILKHDKESTDAFHNFFDDIQLKERTGGILEHIPQYAEKQYTIGLKIAALLHLCEHDVSEPIKGNTAMKAIQIMMWAQNQALKAFSGEVGENPVIVMAYQIINQLLKAKGNYVGMANLKKSLHLTKSRTPQKLLDFGEALEILKANYYIQTNDKELDEKGCKLLLNPLIK